MHLEKLLQFSTDRRADDHYYYVNRSRISHIESASEGGVYVFLSGYGQTNKLHINNYTAEQLADKWSLLRLRRYEKEKSDLVHYYYICMGHISFVSTFGGYKRDDGKTLEPTRVRVFMTGHGVPYALEIEGDVNGVLELIDKHSTKIIACGCKSYKKIDPAIEVFGEALTATDNEHLLGESDDEAV